MNKKFNSVITQEKMDTLMERRIKREVVEIVGLYTDGEITKQQTINRLVVFIKKINK